MINGIILGTNLSLFLNRFIALFVMFVFRTLFARFLFSKATQLMKKLLYRSPAMKMGIPDDNKSQ